jgi:hypothetical protein
MNVAGWVVRGAHSCGFLAVFTLASACAQRENPLPMGNEADTTNKAPLAAPASAPPPVSAPPSASPPPLPQLAPADATTRSQCANICERSSALHCAHASECVPNCLAMQAATPCGAPFSAFYACLVREPTTHYQCDEQSGVAQIKDGFCESEQKAAYQCMAEKMK